MSITITPETFHSFASLMSGSSNLKCELVFLIPGWLKAWWQNFSAGAELFLVSVRKDDRLIGIAPLKIRGETASFIGDADVCDYLDFIAMPGAENEFYSILLDDLMRKGIRMLELVSIRPESTVISHLVTQARELGLESICQVKDVSFELKLPASWDEYQQMLDSKQRHEIRRKLSKLDRSGIACNYRTIREKSEINNLLDTFFSLFRESRTDKASFMKPQMESFFRSVSDEMSNTGLLRFGVLELNKKPGAIIMYFENKDCVFLYNSGYNPQFNSLSVGLISKVLCIKDAIDKRKTKFDFLKGAEPYKQFLGGKEVRIYHCSIFLKK